MSADTDELAKPPLTRDELLTLLRELKSEDDVEEAHWRADLALLRHIDDPEVSAAYVALGRWYA